jgi:hypothetical protein
MFGIYCWFLLTSVVWHLRFRSYLALRVSPRWRVTFFLQLKKVTKKSRPYSFAPRKAFGVPEFSGIGRVNSPGMANLALCARTAHQGGLVGNTREFSKRKRALKQEKKQNLAAQIKA